MSLYVAAVGPDTQCAEVNYKTEVNYKGLKC